MRLRAMGPVWAAVTVSFGLLFGSGMALASRAHTLPGGCQAAGSTGLTAKVVATSGEKITGPIDASGCNIGIYVGPGVHGVTIVKAQITSASDHAIFVQNASRIRILDSVIMDNGAHATVCPTPPKHPTGPCVAEDKPIELVGTTDSLVEGNLVALNTEDGGIGIADDGKLDPGAFDPGTLAASKNNQVIHNVVVNNLGGCGIVVAAYNPGAGVVNNVIKDNLVSGNPAGIIVAADTPQTLAAGNLVLDNTVSGNFLPGVIVHSNAPGDVVTGTVVNGNTVTGNGPDPSANGGQGPTQPTGIIVVAEPLPPSVPAGTPAAAIRFTTISDNTVAQEAFGLWESGAQTTVVGTNLWGTGVTTYPAPTVVSTGTATVNGSPETVLTNAQGMTLYYLTKDSASQIVCTGACAKLWPPLLAPLGQVQGPSGVPGTFSVVNGPNGPQVEYNGHPLYTFAGDSTPGQATGEGFKGVWFVATPSLAAQ